LCWNKKKIYNNHRLFYSYNFFSKKKKTIFFFFPTNTILCKKWNFLSTNNLLYLAMKFLWSLLWSSTRKRNVQYIYIYIYETYGWIIHLQIFPYEWVPLLTIRECWKHGKINFQNWHFFNSKKYYIGALLLSCPRFISV
jgi:hypothetical protein